MNLTHLTRAALFTTSALVALSCGGPQGTTVQRVNPNAQIDLSGNWNDTDANQVSSTMIRDCLNRRWPQDFAGAHGGKKPVVRLTVIRNRSSDNVDTRYFTKQVEQELINSGVAEVVADQTEAQDQRNERADQAGNASDETIKSQGGETGSDYTLSGWINVQHDASGGQEVRAYNISMELQDTKTNKKVWLKSHQIKKVVNRPASEW
jgi:PBP1b-binding outer membrane lipoprotein LpoB